MPEDRSNQHGELLEGENAKGKDYVVRDIIRAAKFGGMS
jgi:hypothetical protein